MLRRCSFVLLGFFALAFFPAASFSGPVDLTTWSALALDIPGGQPPGQWVLSGGNTTVTQIINADPSFFLNNLNQTNYTIEGTWRVVTNSDDDFMGFVFGFQDPAHTYVMDWKQADQNEGPPYNGLGREGFSIKKISAPSVASLTHQDFWVSSNTAHTTILASKYGNYGWQDYTSYDFRLDFTPGTIHVVVMQGAVVLWDVTVNDNTYTSGQFGFYNYSQQTVEYSGFVQTPIFTLDLHPTSCPNPLNLKKRGVIPAAILGSQEGSASEIDVSSLMLEGVAPLRSHLADVATPFDGDLCGCTDEGPDGITDLTLKFDAQDVIATLGDVMWGDEVTLTLTGNLLDGTVFEVSDCMVIRGGPRYEIEPGPGAGEEENAGPAGLGMTSISVPADPIQKVSYELPEASTVFVSVFDVNGRMVDRVAETFENAGTHIAEWDAAGHPSGMYFFRIATGTQVETKKLMVIR